MEQSEKLYLVVHTDEHGLIESVKHLRAESPQAAMKKVTKPMHDLGLNVKCDWPSGALFYRACVPGNGSWTLVPTKSLQEIPIEYAPE